MDTILRQDLRLLRKLSVSFSFSNILGGMVFPFAYSHQHHLLIMLFTVYLRAFKVVYPNTKVIKYKG